MALNQLSYIVLAKIESIALQFPSQVQSQILADIMPPTHKRLVPLGFEPLLPQEPSIAVPKSVQNFYKVATHSNTETCNRDTTTLAAAKPSQPPFWFFRLGSALIRWKALKLISEYIFWWGRISYRPLLLKLTADIKFDLFVLCFSKPECDWLTGSQNLLIICCLWKKRFGLLFLVVAFYGDDIVKSE